MAPTPPIARVTFYGGAVALATSTRVWPYGFAVWRGAVVSAVLGPTAEIFLKMKAKLGVCCKCLGRKTAPIGLSPSVLENPFSKCLGTDVLT